MTISQVDSKLKVIPGTEEYVPCDTLIISVGLIPENEMSLLAGVELDEKTKGAFVDDSLQTNVPGIFAAGNVLHVHDLVDFVSIEAEEVAAAVTEFLDKGGLPACDIPVTYDGSVGQLIPQRVSGKKDFKISLRVKKPFGKCDVIVKQGDEIIAKKHMLKAIPAEMVQLTVSADKLNGNGRIEVCVV